MLCLYGSTNNFWTGGEKKFILILKFVFTLNNKKLTELVQNIEIE